MEVLDVKAPSKAECRMIYYSCECRVCFRSARGIVLRANRMKRLWDVTVGNRFLIPEFTAERWLLRLPESLIRQLNAILHGFFTATICAEVENDAGMM